MNIKWLFQLMMTMIIDRNAKYQLNLTTKSKPKSAKNISSFLYFCRVSKTQTKHLKRLHTTSTHGRPQYMKLLYPERFFFSFFMVINRRTNRCAQL